MKVTILQTDIIWENKHENLKTLRGYLEELKGNTDLVILPEMFSTGFSMNSHALAEPDSGETMTTLKHWASECRLAICGSYIANDNNQYYNRGFFLTPGNEKYFYDKKHLFRMGDEINHFTAGNKKNIIPYRGWNICLRICYELRFPVWSRNVNNEYDLLIYVANWPESRRLVWDILLPARALENACYLCGVNRVGKDGNGLAHNGGSAIYSPNGKPLASIPDNQEGYSTTHLDLAALKEFREKFPVWRDADNFTINE